MHRDMDSRVAALSIALALVLTAFGGPVQAAFTIDFSTFVGGSQEDQLLVVVAGPNDSVYVAGTTRSDDLAVTPGAYQAEIGGGWDAFAAWVGGEGELLALTYLGGSGQEGIAGIEIDPLGRVVVIGHTHSSDFPVVSPFLPDGDGSGVFVARLDSTLSALETSTIIEGAVANMAAAGEDGTLCFAGGLSGLPTLPLRRAFQPARGDDSASDVAVTCLTPDGADLAFSTYLGGGGHDELRGLRVGSDGLVRVMGWTNSSNFPLVSESQSEHGGGSFDGFLTSFSMDGGVTLSTYIGGPGWEWFEDIAEDAEGGPLVLGRVGSEVGPLNPEGELFAMPTVPVVARIDLTDGTVSEPFFVDSTEASPQSGRLGFHAMEIGGEGEVHLLGETDHGSAPMVHPVQPGPAGMPDGGSFTSEGYLATLDSTATTLEFASYLGGGLPANVQNPLQVMEWHANMALDTSGRRVIVGQSTCADYPVVNAFQPEHAGPRDAFLVSSWDGVITRIAEAPDPSVAGEVALRIESSGSVLDLGWDETMDDPVRGVFVGSIRSLNVERTYDHALVTSCDLVVDEVSIDTPDGDAYILVGNFDTVGELVTIGRDSSGQARPTSEVDCP